MKHIVGLETLTPELYPSVHPSTVLPVIQE